MVHPYPPTIHSAVTYPSDPSWDVADDNPMAPYHNDESRVLCWWYSFCPNHPRTSAPGLLDHDRRATSSRAAELGPYRRKTLVGGVVVVVQAPSRDDAQMRGKVDTRGFRSCLLGLGDGLNTE